MKRRALISATAVMLVALMCLVTASYAWFTSNGDATIEAFNVKVNGADAAIELSANGEFYGPSLKLKDFEDDGQVIPEVLDAVSTADGVNFFATNYANSVWTGDASATGKYIVLDFYAKAPAAGTAKLNFDFDYGTLTETQVKAFKDAVKVGVKIDDNDFDLYDINVDDEAAYYQPMIKNTAKCVKDDGLFVPVAGTEASFAAKRTQEALPESINVDVSATASHYTVIVWLEGMDQHCVGNFNDIDAVALGLSFSNYVTTTTEG